MVTLSQEPLTLQFKIQSFFSYQFIFLAIIYLSFLLVPFFMAWILGGTPFTRFLGHPSLCLHPAQSDPDQFLNWRAHREGRTTHLPYFRKLQNNEYPTIHKSIYPYSRHRYQLWRDYGPLSTPIKSLGRPGGPLYPHQFRLWNWRKTSKIVFFQKPIQGIGPDDHWPGDQDTQ